MAKIRFITILCVTLFLIMTGFQMFGDDHIVQEQSRTYMGRTTPPQKIEIWIGNDRMCYDSGNFITLRRNDLGKRYIINKSQKRYLEESIEETSSPTEEKEEEMRIQEFGFNYQPVFDWIVKETDKEKVIDGRTCRCYILDGDADYAEEVREMWVTQDVPIDMERYYDILVKPGLDEEWLKVYEEFPVLKNSLILESQHTTENAIAPAMTWKFKVVTVESKDPPEGQYDIPDGFTKVDTREELYRR